jgi:hypothetical protein
LFVVHEESPEKGNAASDSWRKDRKPIPPISGLQIRDAEKEVTKNTQDYNAKGVLLTSRHPRFVLRGAALRQHKATAGASDSGRSSHNET